MVRDKKIKEIGYLEKGTGKHQSNIVYGSGGCAPTLCAALGIKTFVMILEECNNEQNNSIDEYSG